MTKTLVLIFDEMHIKEDLVFDIITRELRRIHKLENINGYLLN